MLITRNVQWLPALAAVLVPLQVLADEPEPIVIRLVDARQVPVIEEPAGAPAEAPAEAGQNAEEAPPPPDENAPGPATPQQVAAPSQACGPAGCTNGRCGAGSGCRSDGRGGCANGSSIPGHILAGRGYTLGDLCRDIHWKKCELKSKYCKPSPAHHWMCDRTYGMRANRAYSRYMWNAWFRAKINYFIPGGCGGEGCPPFGKYKRVYPVQPDYFDRRDARVYSAAATGVPTAVPLAPNVHQTYNFGWGIPSSRITPLYHVPKAR